MCACVCFQMGMITCFYADENLAEESANSKKKRGETCRHLSSARDRRWGIVARLGSPGGKAEYMAGQLLMLRFPGYVCLIVYDSQ